MEKQEFINFLESEPEHFEIAPGEHEGNVGIFVLNKTFQTQTHFTREAIEKNELRSLINATHHGKNVEHMTRVTGYFSKVTGWNNGKVGELADRHRNGDV